MNDDYLTEMRDVEIVIKDDTYDIESCNNIYDISYYSKLKSKISSILLLPITILYWGNTN